MTELTAADVLAGVPTGLLIAGAWRPAADGATFEVENPADRSALTEIADAGAADAAAAFDGVCTAQTSWAATAPRQRAEILRATYDAMIERIEELALLVTLEMGKPLAEARNEVRYAAEFFRWFGEEAVRIRGTWGRSPAGDARIVTHRVPIGPCLFITPWNFPLAMGARKIAPAVAAGCTMVVKAAQQTPLSMNVLVQIMIDAGLPPEVVSVLSTSSAGAVVEPLMSDRRLRKLSFTGSTEVGRVLARQGAENLLRLSMELGGNAPLIVFDDADLELAIEQTMIAKLRNMGESCIAANRIYVHRPVLEEFSAGLAERMRATTVGAGTDPATEIGPLIDDRQRTVVAGLVADAVERGAEVLSGGFAPDLPGYYWTPTVLSGVDPAARVHNEEIFGPVAPLYPFDTEDDALDLANSSPFGLVSYVFTEGLNRANRVTERLETGMVGVNRGLVSEPAAPFGGVKWSGIGREGGHEGLAEYLETKYVSLQG
ncbi:MAG TPA: NAD-dependent succinate-semialdehyde dehydrogenase [Marmoricola sp.]|jgi:succinate-semialdehyde dehydrogenase/glutarate-semialdehyde dehydrogenase|nr:NAD-dependent succinate-semialdehyde dehydrogenase [Marmoricola sp.]